MPAYNPMPWQVTPGKGFQLTYPGAKGAPYKNPPKKTTKTKSNLKASPKSLGTNSFVSPGAGGALGKYNTQRKVPLSTTSFSNYQGAYNTQPKMPLGVNSFTNYQGAYNTAPRTGWPNLPAGASSAEQISAAPAGPDWMDLLNKLMGTGKGPDYQSMIQALANPGKVSDLATPDLSYIMDVYDDPIKGAYQSLDKRIEELRAGAVEREAAAKAGMEQGFASTKADMATQVAKNNAGLQDYFAKLGIGDVYGGSAAGQQRTESQERLAGLSDILNKSYSASGDMLSAARGANYDTMASMSRGGMARGLSDLASLVAAGQAQAELNTQDYYTKAKLAEAQGRSDLAQIYAQQAGQAQQNQMDMIKLWSQLKGDYESAEAAKQAANPYTETTEDVYQDQDFWDSINALAAGDPTSTALLTKVRNATGSSLPEMQKMLSSLSQPQAPKPGVMPGKFGSMLRSLTNPQTLAEARAAQKLLAAYSNYGGAFGKPSTKTTIKYNSAKEG